jgi:hypothetical protein
MERDGRYWWVSVFPCATLEESFQCLVCCCLSSLHIIKDRNWQRQEKQGAKLDISSYHKLKTDDGMKMETPNFFGGWGCVQVVLFIPWNLQLAIIIQGCSYEIHPTGMLQIVFLLSSESSRRGGVHGLGSMMFGLVVQKLLNIEYFLHWKLN